MDRLTEEERPALSESLEEARRRLLQYEEGSDDAPESPRCVNVEPMTGGRLLLLFEPVRSAETGEVRLFDVSAYFDKGIFARLRDEACFAEAFVDPLGGVEWPCGPGLSRDTLYLKSTPA